MPSTPPTKPSLLRRVLGSAWVTWILLIVVTGAAAYAARESSKLRDHADQRRMVMERLAKLETKATQQSSLVWRGVTMQLAEERMKFVRLRGEEQQGRTAILEELATILELESSGEEINHRLGHEPAPELTEGLDSATHSFVAGVQGTFGQMSLSIDRVRQRLNFWDMNFGQFQEALEAVRARDETIAVDSAKYAKTVTIVAGIGRLLASMFFVFAMAQLRARRRRELAAERLAAVSASEARFRELVRASSDLILVAEEDGTVRYATPSARALVGATDPGKSTVPIDEIEEATERAAEAALAIEAAIDAGTSHAAEEAIRDARCAVDFLLGRTIEELLHGEVSEVTLQDAKGDEHVYDVQASDLREHPDVGGIVLNARNVTERKTLEDRLRHQALHDPLTNLPNRRRFEERYGALDVAEKAEAFVLFLDLDGFKLVNDSYGHGVGDDLLLRAATRIGSCLGTTDVLARQGGDEFLILATGDPEDLASRICASLQPPFELAGNEVFISASVGVVTELAGLDSEQATQRADVAMYAAKAAGKAQAVVFSDEMLAGAPERLALESDFRRALERDEFTVVYQPKVGLRSGVTESLEALVRWIHPERGFVGPDLFIPFAEESGLIQELGRVVLEKACNDAVRWSDKNVVVAVNLSPVQFRNEELVQEVQNALHQSGLDPKYLELEVTESAVLGDVEHTIRVMADLKALGTRLAIDDFGTGYSNLSHLKHYDVDVLKIDQAFVRGGNPSKVDGLSDKAIVEAVIGMAKAFNLKVVAEGVESQAHVDELRDMGADLGQGYLFSKPVSADAIDHFLEKEEAARAARTAG